MAFSGRQNGSGSGAAALPGRWHWWLLGRFRCWLIVQKKPYELSDGIREVLITPSDREIEEVQARKDQKLTSGLSVEVEIFTKGTSYWESLISRGLERNVLNFVDAQMLGNAVSYCNGRFAQLSKHQVKEITRIVEDLKANGIV